jgi:antitoxin component HigA of HigAB toxin-antitoxin module
MEQGEAHMIKVKPSSNIAARGITPIVEAWVTFTNTGIQRPLSEGEYEALIAQMDALTDLHNVEQEPYASLFDLMAGYALEWEALHDEPLPESAPHEALAFLMEQQGLTQKDLERLGIADQPKLSKILSGKLLISKAIAKRLAGHFKVSVDVFV